MLLVNANTKERVDTRWQVETPEGVDFQFEVAGPGRRGLAFGYDLTFIIVGLFVASMIVGVFVNFDESMLGIGLGIIQIFAFAATWLYFSFFEAFTNGRTPGKMILKLRVLRTNGTPIGFMEAFGRGLLKFVDLLPLIIPGTVGLITMVSNPRLQRLGDLVFDTMVVDESRDLVSRRTTIPESIGVLRRSDCSGVYSLPERTLSEIEKLFEQGRYIPEGRREELAVTLANPIARRLGSNTASLGTNERFPATMFLMRVYTTFSRDNLSGPQRPKQDDRLPEPVPLHQALPIQQTTLSGRADKERFTGRQIDLHLKSQDEGGQGEQGR